MSAQTAQEVSGATPNQEFLGTSSTQPSPPKPVEPSKRPVMRIDPNTGNSYWEYPATGSK
jgi:hypothetical protein